MAETVTKKHPIRGAIWGFVLGLGIVGFLIVGYPVIGIGETASLAIQVALIIGGAMLVGILWAMFGPAKKPKGAPPTTRSVEAPAAEAAPASEPEAEAPEETTPSVAEAGPDEDEDGSADPFASS